VHLFAVGDVGVPTSSIVAIATQATRALQTLKTKRAEESSVAAADSVRADFLRIPRNEQLAVVLEMLDQVR